MTTAPTAAPREMKMSNRAAPLPVLYQREGSGAPGDRVMTAPTPRAPPTPGPYRVDLERMHEHTGDTGIYVRAQNQDGSWASADIMHLTRDSLIAWLASRDAEGKGTEWRDRVVLILLGYTP